MTRTIRLSAHLYFAVDLITRSIGVFGHKGSGKTNTGGLLFEQMHAAGAQCVVLDIVGNWWSRRVAGTGPGLKITVFGGKHGDIPISGPIRRSDPPSPSGSVTVASS